MPKIGPQRNQPSGHLCHLGETILRDILRVPAFAFRRAGAGPILNRASARGRGICTLPRRFTLTNALPREGSIGLK